MNELPLMTVSGIRGKYGETLTDEFAAHVAFVQARVTGARKVVVGRDTRPSGERLAGAIFSGISAAGAEPIDIGIAPTPTTCLAVQALEADAGVIITASHNPLPYNGYKMVHRSGRLCNDGECSAVYDALKTTVLSGQSPGVVARRVDPVPTHIERICAAVDVDRIRKAGISIAVDSINGAGGVIFPVLLDRLGVKWTGVHNKLDGDFAHNPEPRPEHLGDLRALLGKKPGLWAGFALDPDADRLAPVGEHGEPVSEEMTLALALHRILTRERTDVAVNLSTSMVIDDVAKSHDCKVFRTKIGEANVVQGMLSNGCLAGGEGNGGVIYPRVSTVRDGLCALALIIELMAVTRRRLNGLVAQWPSYAVVKDKIEVKPGTGAGIVSGLLDQFKSEIIDTQDGLKITREDGWVQIRPSNTEPILRIIAESRSERKARNLVDMIVSKIAQ